jgi:hypothetical protein
MTILRLLAVVNARTAERLHRPLARTVRMRYASGMDDGRRAIAVVQGDGGVQQVLARAVARLGVRTVGVIEEESGPRQSILRSLADGRAFPIFQALGAGAAGCALEPAGVVAAGAQVLRDMAAGCDLVVLNKFGKLEAEEGSGLIDVFGAALMAGVPVLTSVSSRFRGAWDRFAAPFYCQLPASDDAISTWWDQLMRERV